MNDLILQDSGALAIRDSDRIECKDLMGLDIQPNPNP